MTLYTVNGTILVFAMLVCAGACADGGPGADSGRGAAGTQPAASRGPAGQVTMQVPGWTVGRARAAARDGTLRLVLTGVRARGTDRFRVFINPPDAGANALTDAPGYVGTYAFFAAGDAPRNFAMDVARVIRGLPATLDEQPLAVLVVPVADGPATIEVADARVEAPKGPRD